MDQAPHAFPPSPTSRARTLRRATIAALAVAGIAMAALVSGCGSSGAESSTGTTRAATDAAPGTVYALVTHPMAAMYPWNKESGWLYSCAPTGPGGCTRITAAGDQISAIAPVGTRVMVGSNDGTVRDCPGPNDVDAGRSCRTPISPVDSVRAMAALPEGFLVLGRNGRLQRCTLRAGQGPVCDAGTGNVSGPLAVRGDTAYVVAGSAGNEIHSCPVGNLTAGCSTVVGSVPRSKVDFLTVTGIAPLGDDVIVTSRDTDQNPLVHSCRTSSGCVALKGLGDAQSVFAAATAGGVAYVGGGAGDGYIEGPGYVARCTPSGCTRLPREFDGLRPNREGGIVVALAGVGDGFVAGGADQPVPWSCTAADSCTRLGTIDNTQPMTAISQLAPAA